MGGVLPPFLLTVAAQVEFGGCTASCVWRDSCLIAFNG
jgi:hypothetical protein